MTLREFLHDRQIFLLCQLGYLMFAGLLLSMLRVGGFALFFLCGLYLCITLVVLGSEFVKKRSYFNTAFQLLEQLEEKSHLSEILETPDFIEGQKLAEIFRIVSKATNDTVARHRHRWEDYSEYIETWVHEIKTPIASCKLIIENHSDEVTRSLGEEIDRIDQYVEQALYYTRSTVVEKDYVIRRCSLRQLVSQAVRAQAKSLIGHQFRIEMGEDLEQTVYTDGKWMEFILGQIIINAVKYSRSCAPVLSFHARRESQWVSLRIRDNGIGIAARDLPRVFEKGFTGDNGRKTARSTGIGLYLVAQLCAKMSIGLAIDSQVGKWTEVTLNFPVSSWIVTPSES